MPKPSALPSHRLRIDLDGGSRIRPGKIAVLETIEKHGSQPGRVVTSSN